ncbi:glycogen-binding subunit 76A-like [Actinia tenebrosa]|uniref:Glycogen-binding subunit 76A-like n=1 Tax=Actinia tenebrosa TaxID=6105 RepID=A0A6P8HMB0_ACTTE|nr:glycogen-binding subunit 76A-like [Actinia tenebrosa]
MPASTKVKTNILGTAKSDSNLNEGRKDKKVHFADTLGLSLVDVCYYRDTAPRSYHRKIAIRPTFFERERVDRARLLNFIQPLCGKKLIDTLEKQSVALESITIRDYSISGSVKVQNIDYEKKVFIRYTKDSWQSYSDITAEYVYGSNSGTTDTFSFVLVIPNDLEKDFKIEFAICYEVLGHKFWDNNYGDNFRIMWYGSRQFLKSRDLFDIFQCSRFTGFWM